MFSPWSIQEQIIDYKICSFITRFYYQYTYSWKPESLLSAKSRLSKTRCSPGWDEEKSDELFCKKLSNQTNCLRDIKSKEFDRIYISYFSVVLPQPQWVKSIQYSTWKIHLLILLLQDLFSLGQLWMPTDHQGKCNKKGDKKDNSQKWCHFNATLNPTHATQAT